MKRTVVGVMALAVVACGSEPDLSTFPDSDASYQEVNAAVGCESKDSSEKKQDLFDTNYKNRWYIWDGSVVTTDSKSVGIDMNGGGIQELSVTTDGSWGYDLQEGQRVRVKFLLEGLGGCIMPFGGYYGRQYAFMDTAPE